MLRVSEFIELADGTVRKRTFVCDAQVAAGTYPKEALLIALDAGIPVRKTDIREVLTANGRAIRPKTIRRLAQYLEDLTRICPREEELDGRRIRFEWI